MILAQGESGGVPVWDGREAWVDDVLAILLTDEGSRTLREIHVSQHAVLAVAMHDAKSATSTSGRDVATANETVARALGVSKSVVERSRRALRRLGLSVTVAEGRYLFAHERRAAGGQKRAASTRVLTRPRSCPPVRRRRPRDVLHRQVFSTPTRHRPKRSPNRLVDNFPRPIWAQKLAADLDSRIIPRLVPHAHIGSLVDGLIRAGIPIDATASEVLRALDSARKPSTEIRQPLAWFLHQVRSVAAAIWSARDHVVEHAAAPHRHDFRAMLSPTVRGCLSCPATKEIP